MQPFEKNKLTSSSDLRKHLGALLSLFKRDNANSTATQARPPHDFFAGRSGSTHFSKQLTQCRQKCLATLDEILPSDFSDRSELRAILLRHVDIATKTKSTDSHFFSAVTDAISQVILTTFQSFAPNFLIALPATVDKIEIGDVIILSLEQLMTDASAISPEHSIELNDGGTQIQSTKKDIFGNFTISSHTTMWQISITSAQKYAEEQMEWKIGIATSLLRVLAAQTQIGHHSLGAWRPQLSESEPNPTKLGIFNSQLLQLKGGSYQLSGSNNPPSYSPTVELVDHIHTAQSQQKIADIFAPKKQTVGASINSAFGWMSKGRQVNDRSQKLLYFFTALEALLAGSSKSDVTEKVSRYVAVICSNELAKRHGISTTIRKLYKIRSNIVHQGTRDTSTQNIVSIEAYVEICLSRVFDKIDLSMKQADFIKELDKAGFGYDWY